jgi:hypothetical protein
VSPISSRNVDQQADNLVANFRLDIALTLNLILNEYMSMDTGYVARELTGHDPNLLHRN